jgi:plasmid stabilization system protein ParE
LYWNRRALREFQKAFDDLSAYSPQAAIDWRDDVKRMIEMLENYPQIGHLFRHDHDGEIRQVVVGRYRIIYLFTGQRLEMRRVWHVRRDHNPQVIRDGGARRGWPAFIGY